MTKRSGFYEETIGEVEDLYQYQRQGWIYRGQRNSEKELSTTLERACYNYGRGIKEAKDVENVLLREFRRKYHHYSMHIPHNKYTLEWLSLMRHYGAPARLLDFTYSVYIAAYFALEEPLAPGETDKGYAVWAINFHWATKESRKFFGKKSKEYEFLTNPIEDEEEKVMAFERIFRRKHSVVLACPQNPFRLNERLTIQKGIFMCPGDVTKTFKENLCSLQGWKDRKNIVEIIIPDRLRRAVLDKLSDMNISRATLFPGLDGFAQSLKVSPPKRWDYGG